MDTFNIRKAITIVEDFIKKYDLIIKGGIAIDYALRLKGDSIYDDDELPDYDMIVPDTTICYKLARNLCKKGFPNISAIPALYPTTMTVRVDFE